MNRLYQALPALLAFAFVTPAGAAPDQMTKDYQQMCVQAADLPKPHGEWDLKGNPKLPAYCECFGAAFAKRAMATSERMQAGKQPPSLEQAVKEERELRTACRSKAGVPAVPK